MKKSMAFVLVLLILSTVFLAGCGNHKNEELVKKLDGVIMNCSTGFNGSVLIAKDGKIIFEKGYGMADAEKKIPNTKDTTYTIFSVTKQFTATAIMMLEERGLLSLNDPVSKYIPDFKNGDKITIHHLLSMTSGIGDYLYKKDDRPFTVKELITKVKEQPIEFEAGTKYEYSNSNYQILGYIIEKVSGLEYGDFLKQNIFLPLGMNDTQYDPSDKDRKNKANGYIFIGKENSIKGTPISISACYSTGGMYSSVEDLFKWDKALYSEKLVKKGTIEKMFKPNLENYGYGWRISSVYKNCVFHSGGFPTKGYMAQIERYLDSKTTLILLTNEEDIDADDKVHQGLHNVLVDEKIIEKY